MFLFDYNLRFAVQFKANVLYIHPSMDVREPTRDSSVLRDQSMVKIFWIFPLICSILFETPRYFPGVISPSFCSKVWFWYLFVFNLVIHQLVIPLICYYKVHMSLFTAGPSQQCTTTTFQPFNRIVVIPLLTTTTALPRKCFNMCPRNLSMHFTTNQHRSEAKLGLQ